MASIRQQLKAMGWKPDQIATALVDGKPLVEVEAKKPSKVDGMNKTEALYSVELDWLKREGKITDWLFNSVRLTLAYRTTYTPDFLVRYSDGRQVFVEIKGFLRDDAAIKFKLAREKYYWYDFVMLRRVKNAWVEVNI